MDTKVEVLEALKPFLSNNTDRTIVKHLGLGLTPRQISNMGVCSYPTATAKCRAIAMALGAENASLHKTRQILSVLLVRQGGSN